MATQDTTIENMADAPSLDPAGYLTHVQLPGGASGKRLINDTPHMIKAWEEPFEVGTSRTAAQNTTGIQNALDYGNDNSDAGGLGPSFRVQLPAGTLQINASLTISQGTELLGTGVHDTFGGGTVIEQTADAHAIKGQRFDSQDNWDHWFRISDLGIAYGGASDLTGTGIAAVAIGPAGEHSVVERVQVGKNFDWGFRWKSGGGFPHARMYAEDLGAFLTKSGMVWIEGGGSGRIIGLSGDNNPLGVKVESLTMFTLRQVKLESFNNETGVPMEVMCEFGPGRRMYVVEDVHNAQSKAPTAEATLFRILTGAKAGSSQVGVWYAGIRAFNYNHLAKYIDINDADTEWASIPMQGSEGWDSRGAGILDTFGGGGAKTVPSFQISGEVPRILFAINAQEQSETDGPGIMAFHGDPEGAIDAQAGFLVFDTANDQLHWKTTGGFQNNTGYSQLLHFLNGNNLPTSDPLVNGALWNDAGTVKVSTG